MTRWEYKTFKFEADGFWAFTGFDYPRLEAVLNEYGAQGWELVSIAAGSGTHATEMVAVFKRPLTAEGIDFVAPLGK